MGILRDIAMYRNLSEHQILGLYPNKQASVIQNLLAYLVKQRRIFVNVPSGLYTASEEPEEVDRGMMAAIWVLIDFIDQVDYHSTSDFPCKIIFFSCHEVYEIVYVPCGKEDLISNVLSSKADSPPHYIVVVDSPGQIANIRIPNASGYCTVSAAGKVQYYQLS